MCVIVSKHQRSKWQSKNSFFCGSPKKIPSLKLTAKAPENECSWKIKFLLGCPYLRYISLLVSQRVVFLFYDGFITRHWFWGIKMGILSGPAFQPDVPSGKTNHIRVLSRQVHYMPPIFWGGIKLDSCKCCWSFRMDFPANFSLSRKLTYPLKINGWKMIHVIFKWSFLGTC